ncbi:aminotransferase class V-fold PLP-dependent enzyme [Alteriqipengyuania lutimaris]|uniref:Cysteine desulfurase n=1 Tax=Alteriqipengyuania lutimaris TaxID=1538146 RepID=A0A395LJG5_9SPHN|nr:cysteine desulfurase [Alteriqipengyuania lutimaris]MBB3034283.1 cysteine desulfurase/selenocysteine lyase [Alteriqipengyuania lutimaris]RDS76809.1 cysteine desulfurase [Alteriqipengyuania lutimaris]
MTQADTLTRSDGAVGKGAVGKADFPGMFTEDGEPWHYLDSAASAQKPQAVIDAMSRALGKEYATVHRGVYSRSAQMTRGYEAARQRVADFIGAASQDEIVFVRGATEGINLVASSWGDANIREGDRIMLSMLEHHSNIVPWQLLAGRVGAQIDVCPLTEDGQIDLDALERMLTPDHKIVALSHLSNVLGGRLDAKRAAGLAHSVGAKLLLDGCQAAPREPLDMQALDCDFYVFSGHKLYGPTGIGVLWAREDILQAMPPYQGGGAMIDQVSFTGTTYAPAPQRFEAGTPMITEAIALHAAIDYVAQIGTAEIRDHEAALAKRLREELARIQGVCVFGPADGLGIVSFELPGVHPHDLGTILDEENVAIRAGHHCCQPLMDHLGVPATARASFGLYSDESDIEALMRGIDRTLKIFA